MKRSLYTREPFRIILRAEFQLPTAYKNKCQPGNINIGKILPSMLLPADKTQGPSSDSRN